VGISDHTLGVGVAVAAVALGATVIEKHFTLSREEGGVDSSFSLEPDELAALAQESDRAWHALGQVRYGPTEAEAKSLQFRRSIYIAADIVKGEKFTTKNLRIVRPGDGAPPYLLDRLIGLEARKNYPKGTPFSLNEFFNH
jgi:sialic acid synthase SpsE